MKRVERFVYANPQRALPLLHTYNRLFGKNSISLSKGNELLIGASLITGADFDIQGVDNRVHVADFSRLTRCSIRIKGNHNRITVHGASDLTETEFYIEDDGNHIDIGDHTTIAGRTHLATLEGTTIKIGADCMLSSAIHFRTGDSHTIVDIAGVRINHSESIVIGEHVWIGTRVLALKGTSVGSHSIVGAGAVLTRKYQEEHVVIAGNPGRIVKSGVDWHRER